MRDLPADGVYLGVDVGGTFTDAVLLSAGELHAVKSLTTVDDQSLGVLAAIDAVLAQAGVEPPAVRRLAHGTTVATNALLERRGARVAAVLSECCTDLLDLGRQQRPDLYELQRARPRPPVEHDDVIGVAERITPAGVQLALNEDELERIVDELRQRNGLQSVAICLLHSWRDAQHELALAGAIREHLPDLHVVASCELSRELREYERASTTVLDASLTPVLAPYLNRLSNRARDRGLPAPLVMQSSGGLDEAAAVAEHAARALLSGPAGGIVAAHALLRRRDLPALVCLDVGGTSCDVALVGRDHVARAASRELDGLPVQLEMVDMHTIGAGGSSIVHLDAAGGLVVGPQSAGADPGPACYGNGGRKLTITDAHLLVGALHVDTMQHWGLQLNLDTARQAALDLGVGDPLDVAAGAIELATANMAEAARVVSVARGHDAAAGGVLAYGGAGALHACDIADALGCELVLVPGAAGVLSAAGLAVADMRRERSRTVMLEHDGAGSARQPGEVLAWCAAAARQLAAQLQAWGGVTCSIDQELRYLGQAHTIAITTVLAAEPDELAIANALRDGALAFVAEHRSRYGFAHDDRPVQSVTLRIAANVTGPAIAVSWPQNTPTELQPLARELQLPDGRAALAIDLPHGTCLVPQPWHVHGIVDGCLELRR